MEERDEDITNCERKGEGKKGKIKERVRKKRTDKDTQEMKRESESDKEK